MARITRYPMFRHLRSAPSRHVLHYSRGRLRRSGRGLAYWFRPLISSVAEVPCDDRELAFLFHGRSADFQEVSVQGVLTWRVVDPEVIADRVDFSIDPANGRWTEKPLDQLGEVLLNLAQQFAWDTLAAHDVRDLLVAGVGPIRESIQAGLVGSESLEGLGIEIVAVAISKVAPTAEVERALQAPAHESIQQQADEATFRRRALAVEKERAIAENELQNRIELANREADLIDRQGDNDRRVAEEKAGAERVAVVAEAEWAELRAVAEGKALRQRSEAEADAHRASAAAEAEGIRALEEARVRGERERMEIYSGLQPKMMLALAAREFAGKLERIEHLNVGPDMLGRLMENLFDSGSRFLDQAGGGKD